LLRDTIALGKKAIKRNSLNITLSENIHVYDDFLASLFGFSVFFLEKEQQNLSSYYFDT
tara:strand:- start:955 stop:1131 length:177 start_codon:yes stop_codon:yes gene_type:complete